jgi:hypothetical protein
MFYHLTQENVKMPMIRIWDLSAILELQVTTLKKAEPKLIEHQTQEGG